MENKKEDSRECLDFECGFCKNDWCTWGGLMYERPCYIETSEEE